MIDSSECVLVLIDVQGKLAHLMHQKEKLFDNLVKIVRGAILLDVPIIWTEQTPEKMGPTIPELRDQLKNKEPIRKVSFSCWGEPDFRAKLEATGRKKVLLAGIEAHICVCLTAFDLKNTGYDPMVLTDCTSSRGNEEKQAAIDQLKSASILTTCLETVLFEIMGSSEHPAFREILKLIK